MCDELKECPKCGESYKLPFPSVNPHEVMSLAERETPVRPHIPDSIQCKECQLRQIRALIEKAAELAGKELTGKTHDEQTIRNVADMIIREQHIITWNTTDEREAARLDCAIRDDQIKTQANLITDLEKIVENVRHVIAAKIGNIEAFPVTPEAVAYEELRQENAHLARLCDAFKCASRDGRIDAFTHDAIVADQAEPDNIPLEPKAI